MPTVVAMTTRGVAVGKMMDSVAVPKIGMAAVASAREERIEVVNVMPVVEAASSRDAVDWISGCVYWEFDEEAAT